MLEKYADFFKQLHQEKSLECELLVTLNGCTDSTLGVVSKLQQRYPMIRVIDLKNAGKGLAIIAGFKDALTRDNDLIGFVDADMATRPQQFYELIQQIGNNDGIIASRYMKESTIFPPRPWIKEWGRILVYNPIIRLLFGMLYVDFQCGAKLFKRLVIEKIVSELTVQQWAFDIELLYRCKQHRFTIQEAPTVWYDQDDSKFTIRAGIQMLNALFKLRFSGHRNLSKSDDS